jgi:hypothetical protein
MPRMRSVLGSLLLLGVAASFVGSTCDVAADDCNQPEDDHCTADNQTVTCQRPGAEAHRILKTTACTHGTICTIGQDHVPFCARPNSTCPRPGATECVDAYSKCKVAADGGFAWADSFCSSGPTCNDGGPTCGEVL